MKRRGSIVLSACATFGAFVAGCGSERQPLAPSAPAQLAAAAGGQVRKSDNAAARAANGVLTVVNGETDQPVAGAQVSVAGRPFTSDGSGQVTAPDPVLPDAQIEISASGFLKRETVARADTRFLLWPDKGGFDQTFTREVAYFPGFTQDSKLSRPTGGVFVVLSPELDGDAQAAARDAAALLTAATGGQIPFTVAAAPPGAPTITLKVNSGATFFSQNSGAAAFAEVPFLGNVIGGPNGAITFKDAGVSRIRALVAHEMGHHFGLGHPGGVTGLMNATIDGGRSDYSSAEKLAIKLMLARRPGNAFPDNDRAVVGASQRRGVLVFGCALRP
jgi:hypothetical protein